MNVKTNPPRLSKKTLLRMAILLALSLAALLSPFGCRRAPKRPNVVVIVIDTLAASQVPSISPETAPAGLTPNLDRLAGQGMAFRSFFSVSSWTKPTIATVLTGFMPHQHAVQNLDDVLDERVPTLAELFAANGYETAGFISHLIINERFGYGRGFDVYDDSAVVPRILHHTVTSREISDSAIGWLTGRQAPAAPFFLFLHYFDPHYAYLHHPEFDRTSNYAGELHPGMEFGELNAAAAGGRLDSADRDYLLDLHREEIAFTDRHIGRFLDALQAAGQEENTLIVLLADHGEEFMEHGALGHTRTLYNEIMNVPLILRFPERLPAGIRVDKPISQVDLAPTILGLCDLPRPSRPWFGRDLSALLTTESASWAPVPLFAEVDYHIFDRDGAEKKDRAVVKTCLVQDGYKLLYDALGNEWELYNLQVDKSERINLVNSETRIFEDLKSTLVEWEAGRTPLGDGAPAKRAFTPEQLQQLRSLGYTH